MEQLTALYKLNMELYQQEDVYMNENKELIKKEIAKENEKKKIRKGIA